MKTLREILDVRRGMMSAARGRRGQAIIFVMMVLVILAFVVLWQFDLHKTLFVKYRSRNAGDSAALAAARWQALSLNLIGELNMMQAIALSQYVTTGNTNDLAEARSIADLGARVAFTGPLVGFLASQQAAKNNGMYVNADYTGEVLEHAAEIRSEYPIRYPDPPYHNSPEPPSAWDDYATMVEEIASFGIAAWPENARFYTDFMDWNHMLLNPSFYDAISTKDWCWFWFNAYGLLQTYQSYHDWPPLPVYTEPRPASSEYFSLDLRRITYMSYFGAIYFTNSLLTPQQIVDRISQENDQGVTINPGIINIEANWLFYRDEVWASWSDWIGDDFPFRGTIKPQYDYAGADAAVRLESGVDRVTPGIHGAHVVWSAAAKPFGALEGPIRPNQYGLVMPAFTDVRMIPIDASSAPPAGSRPGWGVHIHDHLPNYVVSGLNGLAPGCWYCAQLNTWENHDFRAEGIAWLLQHNSECHIPPPGHGGGGGGGTHRGH